MNKSFIKINERLAASLAYLFGPISGLFFYIGETASGNNNLFVKYHALQSTLFFVLIAIIRFALGIIRRLPFMGMISGLYEFAVLLSLLLLMYMAFSGKNFRIPIIGEACYNSVYKD